MAIHQWVKGTFLVLCILRLMHFLTSPAHAGSQQLVLRLSCLGTTRNRQGVMYLVVNQLSIQINSDAYGSRTHDTKLLFCKLTLLTTLLSSLSLHCLNNVLLTILQLNNISFKILFDPKCPWWSSILIKVKKKQINFG